VRQEFVDPRVWVGLHPHQHVGQIRLGIDAVRFAGGNQRLNPAMFSPGCEPVDAVAHVDRLRRQQDADGPREERQSGHRRAPQISATYLESVPAGNRRTIPLGSTASIAATVTRAFGAVEATTSIGRNFGDDSATTTAARLDFLYNQY
jgi:hypothetical protein